MRRPGEMYELGQTGTSLIADKVAQVEGRRGM